MSRACYFRSLYSLFIPRHGERTTAEGVRFTITRRPGGERGEVLCQTPSRSGSPSRHRATGVLRRSKEHDVVDVATTGDVGEGTRNERGTEHRDTRGKRSTSRERIGASPTFSSRVRLDGQPTCKVTRQRKRKEGQSGKKRTRRV